MFMNLIDLQIMNMNSNSVTLKDFDKLLTLCEKNPVNVISKENLKVYFPEGICSFNRPLFNNLENVNHIDDLTSVSPIVCLGDGTCFVVVTSEGEDFVQDQLTSVTSILLLIKPVYDGVKILDAAFYDGASQYLIKF